MKYIARLLTERIWLRCFASSPKFPFGELQIRLERYTKNKIKGRNEFDRSSEERRSKGS